MPEMRWKSVLKEEGWMERKYLLKAKHSSGSLHLFECEFRIHIQYTMCATSISIHSIMGRCVCGENSVPASIWIMNKVCTLDYLSTENFWSGWRTESALQTYRVTKVHDSRGCHGFVYHMNEEKYKWCTCGVCGHFHSPASTSYRHFIINPLAICARVFLFAFQKRNQNKCRQRHSSALRRWRSANNFEI